MSNAGRIAIAILENDDMVDADFWLNGHLFDPAEPADREVLKIVVHNEFIREHLEAVRDMLAEALVA